MSEIIASGIIEVDRLEAFAETFASKPVGEKNPLVSEIKLHFDSEGFHATAVDPAGVAMVGPTTLHARGFEAYEAPGRATVGVGLETLLDRLSEADAGQLVNFELDMETRMLRIEYGAASMSMRLYDPESVRAEPDLPDLDLPNVAVLPGESFDHAVTIADMLSDHMFVEAYPDDRELVFRGEGDTDDATVSYSDEDLIDCDVGAETESVFSMGYMKSIVKPIPADAEVTLRFGNEFPVEVSWESFDGALEVEQSLAPRIKSS